MKNALLLAALAGLVLVAMPAEAQQTATLTLTMSPPERALTADEPQVTLQGVAVYTADATAYLALVGIPVSYHVTKAPAWASVTISPATDVFPVPSTPSPTYSAARAFTVVVNADPNAVGEAIDQIEITATTAAAIAGKSTTGKNTVPIRLMMATEEPCDVEHPLPAETQPAAAEPAPEVQVQSSAATPVATRWIVVAGFGLVGAGIGLVLRRRL